MKSVFLNPKSMLGYGNLANRGGAINLSINLQH